MTPVLGRTLARERRPILGWVVGVALITLITVASWPGIAESSADFEEILANLPAALTAFFGEGIASFSAAAIVGSRLYGTIGMALFIGYAVSRGARGIAGEEGDGTLELLVTLPVSRTAVAVDKVVAMLLGLSGLVVLELVMLLVAMPLVDLDFAVGNVLAASVGVYLLSALFGGLAFAVGAATGSRGAAVGIAGGLAGGLFLLTGFASLVDWLEPLSAISPFSAYDGTVVLSEGLGAGTPLVFAALVVLLVAVGVAAFDRRDLS
ncbi:ABC transporter permease subunit [Euzebya rosea]|uniref:ABC transporter permease subunit n=1 Tax=Euzebya rosea TaxID=2052804 RepID=UPI000D3E3DFC|nr:ABC transporter permease subunit [Euzebya rosea]